MAAEMMRHAVNISREIQPLYRLSLFDRIFLFLRSFLLDYRLIAAHIPLGSSILDIGCGYGIMPNYLAISDPASSVKGVDIDSGRIAKARETVGDRKNISFDVADISQADISSFNVVLMIDMLHYFPYEEQERIIETMGTRIRSGGRLIFRDPDTKPLWRFYWNRMHETIMVGGNFTKTNMGKLFFRSSDSFRALLEKAGFTVDVYPNTSLSPYSDTLYICRKG